jgi:hypothetical protein
MFPQFIQNALALVDHVSTRREVIKKLSSEGGLARLGEMFDTDFTLLTKEAMRGFFEERLLPFFRIVAHDDVRSSSVLEVDIGTILLYFYGVNGNRSSKVFHATVRGLDHGYRKRAEFEPCLISLSAVLDAKAHLLVNDELRAAAESMVALANNRALSSNMPEYCKKIKLRLGLDGGISAADKNNKIDHAHRKPTSELLVDPPGNLSKQGSRHDNDFADISDIRILPTIGEILAERVEYLPSSDLSTWHLEGAAGLLDWNFRLFREDTVGQLRDEARLELIRLRNPSEQAGAAHTGARAYIYRNVRVAAVETDPHRGLLFALRFDQPHELINKSDAKREEWWAKSDRLAPEALITLLGAENVVIFLTVVAAASPIEEGSIEKRFPRTGDAKHANVVVQPINVEAGIESFLTTTILRKSDEDLSVSLLEFPGLQLPAFQHTLEAIQQMSLSNNLPFAGILASTADDQQNMEVERPAYTKRRGFKFDLSTLSTQTDTMVLDVSSPMEATVLGAQTNLDDSQADALISSLRHSLALIQGPPGTGKSDIGVALMKVLVGNKRTAELGPILCVTSTDHALDQTLQHFVDAGVDDIILTGRRERLSSLDLLDVAKGESLTQLESRERRMHQQNADKFLKLVEGSLSQLQNFSDASILDASILDLLQEKYPCYYVQLVDDAFQLAKDKRAHTSIATWLQGASSISPMHDGPRAQMPASTRAYDIFSLKVAERLSLYSEWKEEIMTQTKRSLLANLKAFQEATAEIDKIEAEVSHRILARANVICVAASGLARNLDLLCRLNSKVLLVEEASEVLEAHLLAAMLPSIEHAILIGDPQLRPRPQRYACENPRSQAKMDVSLFERLVRPKENENSAAQVSTLQKQHRMHPSISALIRPTYPGLRDSIEVSAYPEVAGMRRRLFWLDHRKPEDSKKNRSVPTSHTNRYEVDMVSALVRHLIRQGVYCASDIAILTTCDAQLRKLHHALSNLSVQISTSLQGLRLARIDGFQGKEAKIVIVSLVRSNGEIECILRTQSRINVLLSRAQHGMYIIGNTETSTQIPMFSDVMETLKKNGNVGPHLELCCPRHPGTPLEVATPDDFSIVSPEGGCTARCGQSLPCGDLCAEKCHSDALHQATKCANPPNMVKGGCSDSSHSECGGQCGEHCIIQASNIDVELPCGHHVDKLHNPAQVCSVPVGRTVPGCNHKVTLPCGDETCPPCIEQCDYHCSHARCMKKCSEPCAPCVETECSSCCPHQRCTMPCAAPCDWVPCSERCGKTLECGHQCPSVCGDCPTAKYCQICASADVKAMEVDLLRFSSYGDIDLSKDPCLFLPCGEIFTVSSLDGVMTTSDHYKLDGLTGMPIALKNIARAFSQAEIKTCPTCRGSLRSLPRYGRIVRRTLLDNCTKQFVAWSNQEYLERARHEQQAQVELVDTRSNVPLWELGDVEITQGLIVNMLKGLPGVDSRYHKLADLLLSCCTFLVQAGHDEEPLRSVYDTLALHRSKLSDEEGVAASEYNEILLQTRGAFLAMSLVLRCEIVGIIDFVAVYYAQHQKHGGSLVVDFTSDRSLCEKLIKSTMVSKDVLLQAEGHIFWAQLAVLECEVMESETGNSYSDLRALANTHLESARKLCTAYPRQTRSVVDEGREVSRLLAKGGHQFQTRMVVATVANDFVGTGHWHRCENGHPFAVGEGVMSMETARCPQCDAPVGGLNHELVAGVGNA